MEAISQIARIMHYVWAFSNPNYWLGVYWHRFGFETGSAFRYMTDGRRVMLVAEA